MSGESMRVCMYVGMWPGHVRSGLVFIYYYYYYYFGGVSFGEKG